MAQAVAVRGQRDFSKRHPNVVRAGKVAGVAALGTGAALGAAKLGVHFGAFGKGVKTLPGLGRRVVREARGVTARLGNQGPLWRKAGFVRRATPTARRMEAAAAKIEKAPVKQGFLAPTRQKINAKAAELMREEAKRQDNPWRSVFRFRIHLGRGKPPLEPEQMGLKKLHEHYRKEAVEALGRGKGGRRWERSTRRLERAKATLLKPRKSRGRLSEAIMDVKRGAAKRADEQLNQTFMRFGQRTRKGLLKEEILSRAGFPATRGIGRAHRRMEKAGNIVEARIDRANARKRLTMAEEDALYEMRRRARDLAARRNVTHAVKQAKREFLDTHGAAMRRAKGGQARPSGGGGGQAGGPRVSTEEQIRRYNEWIRRRYPGSAASYTY